MDKQYTTSEVAEKIGIHPNTVRLYEDLGLITKPERKPNGYRIFTQLHLQQFEIARLAFQVEVLQSGLRKQAVDIVKTTAGGEFDIAIEQVHQYQASIAEEERGAEEAIRITESILNGDDIEAEELCLTRQQIAEYLHVTIDTLRNWELNGLLSVKRKKNGYRIYNNEDIERLKIIKSLRCANYSLAAILRMLGALSKDPGTDIRMAIDTARYEEDIITACDNLLTSLSHARDNMTKIHQLLKELKQQNN